MRWRCRWPRKKHRERPAQSPSSFWCFGSRPARSSFHPSRPQQRVCFEPELHFCSDPGINHNSMQTRFNRRRFEGWQNFPSTVKFNFATRCPSVHVVSGTFMHVPSVNNSMGCQLVVLYMNGQLRTRMLTNLLSIPSSIAVLLDVNLNAFIKFFFSSDIDAKKDATLLLICSVISSLSRISQIFCLHFKISYWGGFFKALVKFRFTI